MNDEEITCVFQGLSNKGNIFLSSYLATKNTSLIKALGISAILSISQDKIQENTIQILQDYSHLRLQKDQNNKISLYFDESYQFIEQVRKKTNILINCETGNNQSAVLAIAYLIKKYPYNVSKVFSLLKRKKSHISISNNYINELNNFAAMLNPRDTGIKQNFVAKKTHTRVTSGDQKKIFSHLRNNIKQVSLVIPKISIHELKQEDSKGQQKHIENFSGLERPQNQIKELIEIDKKKQQAKQEQNKQIPSQIKLVQIQIKNGQNKNFSNISSIQILQSKLSLQIQKQTKQEQIDDLAQRFQKFLRRETKYKTLFEPGKSQTNSQRAKIISMKLVQNQQQNHLLKAFQSKDLNAKVEMSFDSNEPQFFSKQLVTQKQIQQKDIEFGRSRSQSSTLKSALKKTSSIKNASQSKKTVKFSAHNIVHDFDELNQQKRTSITQMIQKRQQQKKKFLSFKSSGMGFGGIILR